MVEKLLRNTTAYKTLVNDKKNGTLSHSYLFSCQDEVYLRSFLKAFAKIFICKQDEPCLTCRECELIDKEIFSDVIVLPEKDKVIMTDDVTNLISQSFVKSMEGGNRVFALCGVDKMNVVAQNKLLKTLEEPPKNTYILLGASSLSAVLPTIKSRAKKIDIKPFNESELLEFFKDKYSDAQKLENSVNLSGGNMGEVDRLYNDEKILGKIQLAFDILLKMKSSQKVISFASKIDKENINEIISLLKLIIRDVQVIDKNRDLVINKNKIKELLEIRLNFKDGALIQINEELFKLEKSLKYYANTTMLVDNLLFSILEEKYKWQKL